ncbi:MAG: hypothetical protein Q6L60_14870 [Thermostichus sp. HHBFW_bins_43]
MLPDRTATPIDGLAQQIETILATYPPYPHQAAFANPHLRQRLCAQVLMQLLGSIPTQSCFNCPFVDNDGSGKPCWTEAGFWDQPIPVEPDEDGRWAESAEITLAEASPKQVSLLIHRSIAELLRQHYDWINHVIPNEIEGDHTPSNWFG